MDLVEIEQVRAHCRAEAEDDALLELYATGAEQAVQAFLNRRVFPSPEALADAVAAMPAEVAEAETAHADARAAAADLEGEARCVAEMAADAAWSNALTKARETAVGMVVNDDIRDAVLLITAHRYRNREAVITGTIATPIPQGVTTILWPYRVGLGV